MILVHKLDRFSRNREESILFKSLLRKHGVSVKSITENFDPETPQGFLYEGMIEVINQFYSMNLATETMKGMRENADRGYRNGGSVPYGYRAKKVAGPNGREHTVLEPGDPERVAVIQEIFRRAVVEGASVKAITNSLNERRVPAPRGRWWNCSTIGIVLNNRAYVGDTVWNKKNAKRHQRKPTEQLVVMENTHEPLVDRELFLRRKKLADAKTFGMRTSPHRHVPYLLSRLMRCSNCGAAFVGRGQRTVRGDKHYEFHRYYCASYLEKGTSVCGALSIRREWVEGEVLGVLRQEICSPERLAALEQLVRQKIEERRKRYCRDPRELQRRLDGINLKIKNYYQAIGEGLDAATCKERIAALEVEKAEVETEAELLNQDDYYRRALEMNVEELRKFASAFDSEFTGLPFHVQRQVVLHFIERIEVIDRELIRITVKVPFDNNGVRRLTGEVESPSPEAPKAASQAAPSAPAPVVQVGPSRGANVSIRRKALAAPLTDAANRASPRPVAREPASQAVLRGVRTSATAPATIDHRPSPIARFSAKVHSG
jgi:DNA invertase Pin-like site-specific DNA recombinase